MRRRQRAANEKGKNMTAEIMDAAKAGMEKALSNLNEAFVNVRTGRANPMVLDKIRVDYYGVPTPIKYRGLSSGIIAVTISVIAYISSAGSPTESPPIAFP